MQLSPNTYYVYIHYTVDTKIPFYVGMGKVNPKGSQRYSRTDGRNETWNYYKDNHGFYHVIIESNLTKEEAFELEEKIIKQLREQGFNLANKTDGGKGSKGFNDKRPSKLSKEQQKIMLETRKEMKFYPKDKNFLVYGHITADTGEFFNVGKGSISRKGNKGTYRHRDFNNRSPEFNQILNTRGCIPIVLGWFDTEEEAFNVEMQMIKGLRDAGVTLVNKTDGGKGTVGNVVWVGRKHTEESKKKLSKSKEGTTHSPETKDKMSVGLRGENSPSAILNEVKVLEIREKWATKLYSQKYLANYYKVSTNAISDIVTRKNWKHI